MLHSSGARGNLHARPTSSTRDDTWIQLKAIAAEIVETVYTWKELPQPQVDFTWGLLNLNPAPSSVST